MRNRAYKPEASHSAIVKFNDLRLVPVWADRVLNFGRFNEPFDEVALGFTKVSFAIGSSISTFASSWLLHETRVISVGLGGKETQE